ncbi:class I SAM-dependent DNA methyltransferase [Salinispora arenicola]|uniref:class I SAM-dependent DNA methyltransferase n=1 Tax=Salinispora arenicola TaxID=168697 RepID=UPI002079AF3E|nr:methyltransferase domain-containing protein [Salinispora arenicola]MCN0152513.1 class I SAM-dependent methyltransferase [Salinispora arenicola]
MPYGADHAELYDVTFRSRGKDFVAEADTIAGLVLSRRPGATSLLDVACGTGAHLEAFRAHFRDTAGVELADGMRAVAAGRGLVVWPGDMRTFDLGRTFDALTCLGNSLPCVPTADDVRDAVATMVRHVEPGGVLVVEPWWFPPDFIDGYVGGHVVTEERRVISRVTRSIRLGQRTRMSVHFTVAEPQGVRTFVDELDVGLFERRIYESAFKDAGCSVELVSGAALSDGRPNGPGLFVAVRNDLGPVGRLETDQRGPA